MKSDDAWLKRCILCAVKTGETDRQSEGSEWPGAGENDQRDEVSECSTKSCDAGRLRCVLCT